MEAICFSEGERGVKKVIEDAFFWRGEPSRHAGMAGVRMIPSRRDMTRWRAGLPAPYACPFLRRIFLLDEMCMERNSRRHATVMDGAFTSLRHSTDKCRVRINHTVRP